MSNLHLKIRKRNRALILSKPRPPPPPPLLPTSFSAEIIFHPHIHPQEIPLPTGLRRDTRTVTLTIDFLSSIDNDSTHGVDSMPMEELANSVCRGPEHLVVHCKFSKKKKFSLFRHWVLMQRFEKALVESETLQRYEIYFDHPGASGDGGGICLTSVSPTKLGDETATTSEDVSYMVNNALRKRLHKLTEFTATVVVRAGAPPSDLVIVQPPPQAKHVHLRIEFANHSNPDNAFGMETVPIEDLARTICEGPQDLLVSFHFPKGIAEEHWVLVRSFRDVLRGSEGLGGWKILVFACGCGKEAVKVWSSRRGGEDGDREGLVEAMVLG
ncbi:unnamed protein product [Zymoseptoria tritici ST99CH_1E4]|uniref:Uncharacterized protein n=1 Tax=Zymoseptoria tritici ST99CH_1E4 TaxID=1276532 RepID=A0A2H1GQC8_ZYMTR|nr:unnamed protein product [Zymoseptoria tritici ST99CH_1E4]